MESLRNKALKVSKALALASKEINEISESVEAKSAAWLLYGFANAMNIMDDEGVFEEKAENAS